MGTYLGHLYIITICVFFLWVGFGSLLVWGYKKLIWDPYVAKRKEAYERARRMADRRG